MFSMRQSSLNVIVSAIVVAFYCGCSGEDNQPSPSQFGGSSSPAIIGGAGTNTMSAMGGTQTTESIATKNAAGAGGSATAASIGGKKGSAGASGKAGEAAGKSASGNAGKAGNAGNAGKVSKGGQAGTGGDPCGADAKTVTGTTATGTSGFTEMRTSGDIEVVRLLTTMIVPAKPTSPNGTLFLWPGLQPLNYTSTGYGVLQPVLTWGTSCSPDTRMTYDHWWISGMYVGYGTGSFGMGCKGGDAMDVEIGDKLDIDMVLNGTVWSQIITNRSNGQTVDFDWDLQGQLQQWVIFDIEMQTATRPSDDVIFENTVVKFSGSAPKSCVPTSKGAEDYYSAPRASSDGKTCCIEKLILRASGVAATSPNKP